MLIKYIPCSYIRLVLVLQVMPVQALPIENVCASTLFYLCLFFDLMYILCLVCGYKPVNVLSVENK